MEGPILYPDYIGQDKSESYAGTDASWPCLSSIYKDDAQKLNYIVSNMYVDASQNVVYASVDQPFADKSKFMDQSFGQPLYAQWTLDGNAKAQINQMATIDYKSLYPGEQFNCCTDESFKNTYPTTHMFGFYFGATVSASALHSFVRVNVATTAPSTKPCYQTIRYYVKDFHNDSWKGGSVDSLTNVQNVIAPHTEKCYNHAGFLNACATAISDGYTPPTPAIGALPKSMLAHMRDNLNRSDPSQTHKFPFLKNGVCPCISDFLGSKFYFQGYAGYVQIDGNYNVKFVPTSKAWDVHNLDAPPSQCALPVNDKYNIGSINAKVMTQKNYDQTFDVKYMQLLYTQPSDHIIQYAQSVPLSGAEGIVISFNVPGRVPTCLSPHEANPVSSTAGEPSSTDVDVYRSAGAMTAEGAQKWTWDANVDLGTGVGAHTSGPSWDRGKFPDWPSTNTPNDIVVRLYFSNWYILDATKRTYKTLSTSNDYTKTLTLLTDVAKQNSFASNISNVGDLIVPQRYRALMVCEYLGFLVYNTMYGYNLEFGYNRNYVFTRDVAPSIGSESRSMYTYLQKLMQDAQIDFKSVQHLTLGALTNTVQDEVILQCQEILSVQQTQPLFQYPQFEIDKEGDIYVYFYVPVYIHGAISKDIDVLDHVKKQFFSPIGFSISRNSGSQNGVKDLYLENPMYCPDKNLYTAFDNVTYTSSYCWKAHVPQMTAFALYYILATQPTILSGLMYNHVNWGDTYMLFTPVQMTSSSLNQCLKDINTDENCMTELCSQTKCLCDFTMLVDGVVNPRTSLYYNTSNGGCTCAANQSYPITSQPNNIITTCFSYGCEKCKVVCPSYSDACDSFKQVIDSVPFGKWTEAFMDGGDDLDVDVINSKCGIKLVKPTPYSLNSQFKSTLYTVIGCAAFALSIPLYYSQCVAQWTPVHIVFCIVSLLLGVALAVGTLFFINGHQVCVSDPSSSAPFRTSSQCVDGIFQKVSLPIQLCGVHTASQRLFCQCAPTKQCDISGNKFVKSGQCSSNGICDACASRRSTASKFVSVTDTVKPPYKLDLNVDIIIVCIGIAALLSVIPHFTSIYTPYKWVCTSVVILLAVGIAVCMQYFIYVPVKYTLDTKSLDKNNTSDDPCSN